jgi:hypothetical protein
VLPSDFVRTFASTLLQSAIRPEGLATAGAMLTCVAVVLNVGPFVAGQRSEPPRLALAGDPMPKVMPMAWQAPAGEPVATTADPEPAVEPETTVATAPAEPALFWLASAEMPVMPVTMAADTQESRPAEPAADHAPPEAAKPNPVVGVWSPDGGNCSARDFKDGTLPTVINAEGAWAGETFCVFTKRKETEAGWRVVAKCSAPRARWTSNVRLTVSDNRLTWASERGTQAYTRCAPDVLMAQAK